MERGSNDIAFWREGVDCRTITDNLLGPVINEKPWTVDSLTSPYCGASLILWKSRREYCNFTTQLVRGAISGLYGYIKVSSTVKLVILGELFYR